MWGIRSWRGGAVGLSTGNGWQLLVTSDSGQVGKPKAFVQTASGNRTVYGPARVDDGAWHHVALTVNRTSGIVVWVDGSPSTSSSALTGDVNNTTAFTAGRGATGTPNLNGDLDELAIYAGLLTTDRIQQRAKASKPQDSTAPALTWTAPANGSTQTSTPTLSTTAATGAEDSDHVRFEVFTGTTATGTPSQVLSAVRGAGGATSLALSRHLGVGQHTVRASQLDGSGNSGVSTTSTFTVQENYRSRIAADGAAGYWRLGEPSGVTSVDEIAGNTMTLSGSPLRRNMAGALTGDSNPSTEIDDPTGKGTVPDTAALDAGSGDFTVEGWIRTTKDEYAIASKIAATGPGWQLRTVDETPYNGQLRGIVRTTGGTWTVTSTTAIVDNAWHHIALVKTATGLRLLIDGTVNGTLAQTISGSVDNSEPFLLGAANSLHAAEGFFDEWAIYRTALTDQQLQSHYQLGKGQTPVLPPPSRRLTPTPPAPLITTPAAGSLSGDYAPRSCAAPQASQPGTRLASWSRSAPTRQQAR